MVWTLKVNVRTKISLVAILSLGSFAYAATIIKTPLHYNYIHEPDPFGMVLYLANHRTLHRHYCRLPDRPKPLFNWFLETAKALTGGSGTRTKPSAYKHSASLGYLKKPESSSSADAACVELGSMPSDSSAGKSPYAVRVMTGEVWDRAARGMSIGRGEQADWDIEGAKKSDDSILPPGRNAHGIVRTTEVRVSLSMDYFVYMWVKSGKAVYHD